jgi:hypothetical protein
MLRGHMMSLALRLLQEMILFIADAIHGLRVTTHGREMKLNAA